MCWASTRVFSGCWVVERALCVVRCVVYTAPANAFLACVCGRVQDLGEYGGELVPDVQVSIRVQARPAGV